MLSCLLYTCLQFTIIWLRVQVMVDSLSVESWQMLQSAGARKGAMWPSLGPPSQAIVIPSFGVRLQGSWEPPTSLPRLLTSFSHTISAAHCGIRSGHIAPIPTKHTPVTAGLQLPGTYSTRYLEEWRFQYGFVELKPIVWDEFHKMPWETAIIGRCCGIITYCQRNIPQDTLRNGDFSMDLWN